MFWCLVITHGASDLGLNPGDSIAHDWGWYHIYTSADHVLVALCNLKVLAYYNCCRKETRLHILKAFLMTILSLTVLLEAHRILCMTQTSIKGLRFVPIPLQTSCQMLHNVRIESASLLATQSQQSWYKLNSCRKETCLTVSALLRFFWSSSF